MKKLLFALFTFIILVSVSPNTSAQCSMCRAVAESGARGDGRNVARGLNNGILYLLSMPYIIGGIAFYVWRKNRRKQPLV